MSFRFLIPLSLLVASFLALAEHSLGAVINAYGNTKTVVSGSYQLKTGADAKDPSNTCSTTSTITIPIGRVVGLQQLNPCGNNTNVWLIKYNGPEIPAQ